MYAACSVIKRISSRMLCVPINIALRLGNEVNQITAKINIPNEERNKNTQGKSNFISIPWQLGKYCGCILENISIVSSFFSIDVFFSTKIGPWNWFFEKDVKEWNALALLLFAICSSVWTHWLKQKSTRKAHNRLGYSWNQSKTSTSNMFFCVNYIQIFVKWKSVTAFWAIPVCVAGVLWFCRSIVRYVF